MNHVREAWPSYSIAVNTPDGEMFVHIAEENDMPKFILINIGKAGTNIAAWGDAIARVATAMLPVRGVHGVIEELSGLSSARFSILEGGQVCHSGPEGLALALLKYNAIKYKQHRPKRRPGGASRDP